MVCNQDSQSYIFVKGYVKKNQKFSAQSLKQANRRQIKPQSGFKET